MSVSRRVKVCRRGESNMVSRRAGGKVAISGSQGEGLTLKVVARRYGGWSKGDHSGF